MWKRWLQLGLALAALAVCLFIGLCLWADSEMPNIRLTGELNIQPLLQRRQHLSKIWETAMDEDRRNTPVGKMTTKEFLDTLGPPGWLVDPWSGFEPRVNPDLAKWFRPLGHEHEIALYCPDGVWFRGKTRYAVICFDGSGPQIGVEDLPSW